MKLLKGFEQKILTLKDRKTVQVFYRTCIALFTVVFLFCLFQISKLKSEYSVKQFFPKSHFLLSVEQKIKTDFKLQDKSSLILIVSQTNNSTWLNKSSLNKITNLTEKIKKIPHVQKVIALSSVQGAYEGKNDLFVGPLFEQVPVTEWHKLVKSQPFIRPFLLSENLKQTLIAIELSENNIKLINSVKSEVNKLNSAEFKDLQILMGGVPSLQADVSALLRNELVRSIGIGFIFFIFILFFIFKNTSGVLLTLTNLLFVNIVSLGCVATLGISFDVLLSTLPVLIGLTTISMTVQILIRHAQNTNQHTNEPNHIEKLQGIYLTLKNLFFENALVSLTTILGFAMLAASDIMIIKKYGFVVSGFVFLSWLLTQLTMIPLVVAFPHVQLRSWFLKKAFWSLIIFKFKKPILAISTVLIIFSIVSIFKLNWSSRLFDDLPKNNLSRLNTELIDKNFGGTLPLSITIQGSAETWKNPIAIVRLNQLTENLKKLSSVGSALSFADLIKKTNGAGNRLPASKQETAESLFLFSMAETDPSISFLNQEKHVARIDLRLKDKYSDSIFADEARMKNLVREHFPNHKFYISGMATSIHKMNADMSKDLIFGFWQSISVIALFLIFIFRSFRWTIIACLPNLIPPLFLIAVLAITKTPIKPSIAIIFSIAIGLAFTNTVYILMQLKKLTRQNFNHLPIKKTMLVEMIPCFLSTLLATSAFMVFLFSYFDMNKLFGAYMIVSLVAGAFGDLVFLPALLSTFPQLLLQKKKPTKISNEFAKPAIIILALVISPILKAESKKSVLPQLTAEQIFTKSKALLASQDDSADVLMKIIEADGTTKERGMSILRKNTKTTHSTLVRMKKPIDLKGTALLSQIENGTEQQWIYLPSAKQSRRVVGASKKGNVLGSELSPQDLDFATLKAAQAKLVKTIMLKNHNYALIEIKSSNNETEYNKALILISLENFLPMRIEYYNAKNKVLKRVEFDQYKNFGGAQRAQSIRIKNLVNKRGTDLTFSAIKSNSGLSDEVFSQRALSKE
jgi:predicted RND superfamily exporter protein